MPADNVLIASTMKTSASTLVLLAITCLTLPACNTHGEAEHPEVHRIVATSPEAKAVTVTQKFVCQIHSRRHIKIRALETGYLEEVPVHEGQVVKKDDVMFQVVPIIYQAKLDAELAEQDLAQMQLNYSKQLAEDKVVSKNEVLLEKAKLTRAQAKADLAKAQLKFATVSAPFDGIVDRLLHQQGSLVEEGDTLTTLSDNSLMWVYFNVPEAIYLDFMTSSGERVEDLKVELKLANGRKFSQIGGIGAIEADFNNQTGNIPFRADFPNPDRLLRHGQTGTVLINRVQKDAIVIPQRATFPILDKRYVYVIDQGNFAHQREIEIEHELEDIFVVKSGLSVNDKFVLEGVRDVRDGDKVQYEERDPQQALANLKFHAE